MPMHPGVYADLLSGKMEQHGSTAWLINTGWTGGKYGEGSRIKLKYSRAIMDAIHDGSLDKVPTETMDVFGVEIPTSCPGVPSEILNPRDTWKDKSAYDEMLHRLGGMMVENFKEYEDQAGEEILAGGP